MVDLLRPPICLRTARPPHCRGPCPPADDAAAATRPVSAFTPSMSSSSAFARSSLSARGTSSASPSPSPSKAGQRTSDNSVQLLAPAAVTRLPHTAAPVPPKTANEPIRLQRLRLPGGTCLGNGSIGRHTAASPGAARRPSPGASTAWTGQAGGGAIASRLP